MRQLSIYFFAIFFMLISNISFSQSNVTLHGTVKSSSTGETLAGVVVYCVENHKFATITDQYGRYALNIDKGQKTIIFSTMGFKADTVKKLITSNELLNVELTESAVIADNVVVTSTSGRQRLESARVGVERISTQEMSKIPIIFGEKDILKSLQLMPGVKSNGDGSAGFTVRGGSLDQNLILLDNAPVYNASHLMGFFSTFNSLAIKDVTLYKGNFPAQYGGRIASVVDVTMNDGNTKQYIGNVGIGLISGNLSFEGPIQKDRSSFLVTARRTYADLFLGLSDEYRGNQLHFYDINVKANVEIDNKNKLYLSAYFGRDATVVKDIMGMDWGNLTGTLRWNSVISPNLFSNTMFIYSDYDYQMKSDLDGMKGRISSKINDLAVKQDFHLNIRGHYLRFGLNSTFHTLSPMRISDGEFSDPGDRRDRKLWENAVYASYSGRFFDRLSVEAGLRLASNTLVGPAQYNIYNQGNLEGSVDLSRGEFGKTFVNLEPRLSLAYTMTPTSSIKVAYTRSTQYIHMLNNSTITLPNDHLFGTSYTMPPTLSDQVSLGFFKNFPKIGLELSVEAYYKSIQDEADFKSGADLFSAVDIESELLFGKGRAYGLELMLKKTAGAFTGWIGYTLSRTERQIDGINNNNWYPTRYDKTHDFSIVGMYQINPKWQVSGVWVYSTGNAITVPSGKYLIDGKIFYHYSDRNGYRLPAYHRLDLSATYTAPMKGKCQGSWNFGIYNAYGRENPYMIYYTTDKNNHSQAVQVSLFRFVPSVTYNLKFGL